MAIRTAGIADMDQMYDLCQEFQAASPYADIPISDDKYYEFLNHYLTPKPDDHIVLIYEKEGIIEGMLAGIITSGIHFFSENKVATELAWYVRPAARNTSAPIRLLHAYEEWAKLMGCQKVSLATLNNEYRETLTKMYIKMGYLSTEETFVRDI
jgi:GNAT superfamily N-acetyltransferase